MEESTLHLGKKISRMRELRGMKQETLAAELGISQQAVSKIEQSPDVEDDALERIAKILGVTPDAVRNFSEEAVFNYFNNFSDNSINQGPIGAHNTCNFNPLDKVVELYERLLKSEQEKLEILKNKS
ncbi:transcriptional regulator [Mucilaginibacter sp. PPCGB 2223]|uniref:helix-turn-helix domain-containing protein n=1 Tax=Mucilaginibacter sp. PPCGB 2223 TaxID=1886027 RepID=UPI0008252917|nr:helix-turn-helix transcriptional regulator [Mucilaginibacter sp. PPCGB 2223]OCX54193.1 transcriptional regulator [Mucilaginibacter sp. PPCGB 2223]